METRARYLLVGLFSLFAAGTAGWFVYWLNNPAGLSARASYAVQFEGAVAGLRAGSAVLFNGIRVGEVTRLQLDPREPAKVLATISVQAATPVRTDTAVAVETQGLMGTPTLTLRGGSAAALPLDSTPLHADAAASQDLSQAAREALKVVQQVVAENADPLRTTIANLRTFTDALARNSGRLDTILDRLERLAGGSSNKPLPVYDLAVPADLPKAANLLPGRIAVPEPTALLVFDTQRILTEGSEGGLVPLENAQWRDNVPKLVQAKIVQAFERAGYGGRVSRPTEGVAANHQLLIEVRAFQLTNGDPFEAEIEVAAKFVEEGGAGDGFRVFRRVARVSSRAPRAVTDGFSASFGQICADLLSWTGALPSVAPSVQDEP